MFEKLENFIRTETVVGKQIQVGDVTLIPIISVSFGVSAGSGSDKGEKGGDSSGAGGGMGAKVQSNAIVVVKEATKEDNA